MSPSPEQTGEAGRGSAFAPLLSTSFQLTPPVIRHFLPCKDQKIKVFLYCLYCLKDQGSDTSGVAKQKYIFLCNIQKHPKKVKESLSQTMSKA